MGHVVELAHIDDHIDMLRGNIAILQRQQYSFDSGHVPIHIIRTLEDANRDLEKEINKRNIINDIINKITNKFRNIDNLVNINQDDYNLFIHNKNKDLEDEHIYLDFIKNIIISNIQNSILFQLHKRNNNDENKIINYISSLFTQNTNTIPIIIRLHNPHEDENQFLYLSIQNFTNNQIDYDDIIMIINKSSKKPVYKIFYYILIKSV